MINACNFLIKIKWRRAITPDFPGTIYFYVSDSKASAKLIFTPYKLYKGEWNSKKAIINGPISDERNIPVRIVQARIKFDLERLNHCALACSTLGELVDTFESLKSPCLFFSFMEEAIEHLIDLGQFTTANNYIASYRSFFSFCKNYRIAFPDLTPAFVEKYEAMMKLRKIKSNTTAFYLRNLRAVYYKAVDRGLTYDKRPFRRVFTGRAKTKKRAISPEDLRRIKALDLRFRPALDFARDAFMFSFYGRGMSMIDVAHVSSADRYGDYIIYNRSKTDQPLRIKVLPQMQAIIDKYCCDDGPYLLPLIKHGGIEEDKEYRAAIRRINNNLKKIAQMAGISTPLTTYVARHTWASIGKAKNVPITIISDCLGHESITTTEIYLKSIDQASIDAANELVTDGL